ncbi:hypothetical protein WMF18_24820 [Sorangium sp. So ce315]
MRFERGTTHAAGIHRVTAEGRRRASPIEVFDGIRKGTADAGP